MCTYVFVRVYCCLYGPYESRCEGDAYWNSDHVAIAAMVIVRLCQNESRSQDYLIKYKRTTATEIRDEN